ncbi:MAG TPA: helix-turn-helix domain-containing protein [Candidatus Krumholzibacteria bacterium]|nr:helix-turn-helix domain-containing protein [Candidatus Krumholzibacteria bacterium]
MDTEKSLESLGLTPIESLAYVYLVANPSSTGYRVARGIGKPTANVYRALESLGRKGAVLHDRAATPLFRAVAPDDLLARLEREFMQRKAAAARELKALRPDEGDERIYALKSFDQVLARARIMLASARRVVMMDAMSDLAAALSTEIDDARRRGVRVLIRARVPLPHRVSDGSVLGEHVDTRPDTRPAPGRHPSLRMAIDAREALMVWFSVGDDRFRDALWTRSDFLARSQHDALAAERCCVQIETGMVEGLSVDEVEAVFEEWKSLRAMV